MPYLSAVCASISIHALREEGDLRVAPKETCYFYFYPRPPRGGRPLIQSHLDETKIISIHALREEGDTETDNQAFGYQISIHALREEGDQKSTAIWKKPKSFLSTPSARRATGFA